jgi:hypothetical protein
MTKMRERVTVLAFALAVLGFIVGSAFAIGYLWECCSCDLRRDDNQRRPARRSQRLLRLRRLDGHPQPDRLLRRRLLARDRLLGLQGRAADGEDPWLVAMATSSASSAVHRPIIYLFFRPPEYIEDVRERELEIRAMEDRLSKRDLHCPVCRAAVDPRSSSARSARPG